MPLLGADEGEDGVDGADGVLGELGVLGALGALGVDGAEGAGVDVVDVVGVVVSFIVVLLFVVSRQRFFDVAFFAPAFVADGADALVAAAAVFSLRVDVRTGFAATGVVGSTPTTRAAVSALALAAAMSGASPCGSCHALPGAGVARLNSVASAGAAPLSTASSYFLCSSVLGTCTLGFAAVSAMYVSSFAVARSAASIRRLQRRRYCTPRTRLTSYAATAY